ncbi:MAG: hypothetical protein AAF889_11460, partial [Cyanobacteria bacterium P01_D01_bin.73]
MLRSTSRPEIDLTEGTPDYKQIQPHGALIALSEPELIIVQASCNVDQLLGVTAQELVGQPLSAVWEPTESNEFFGSRNYDASS